ncbi:MAG: DMT family transporter [Bacteroidales bacterium]
MSNHLRQFVHLHFIVILLGFTAILGAIITLNAVDLVWYRMFFASIGLLVFFRWRKIPWRISWRKQLPLLAIGTLVALHWITFFYAIKVSNVSVTLGVFASTTLFTSFLEPMLQKRRIFWLEVVIGLVIISGIYLIFQYEFHYIEGILFSLLSALLNGLFVVLNRNISLKHHPSVISFYEMIGGFLFITVYIAATNQFTAQTFSMSGMDLFLLLVLSLVCTSYAFTAIVDIMKVLSAYTVVLAVNLEPVYGIIMAFFFFPQQEAMSAGFYAGTAIILASVFSFPFLKRKFRKVAF